MCLTKNARLNNLFSIIETCQLCALGANRNKMVFGEGNIDCPFMFIAEAPGMTEDQSGRPLIGRSGTLLRKMIDAIDLTGSMYLCNICKCIPPGNRKPEDSEIEICVKFLKKQIEIIEPKLIVLLGRTAVKGILPDHRSDSLEMLRDQSKLEAYKYNNIPVVVTYHPSALLRNPGWKQKAKEDFQYIQKQYHIMLRSCNSCFEYGAGCEYPKTDRSGCDRWVSYL